MKKLFGMSIVLCMLLVFIPTSFAQTNNSIDLKDLEGLSSEVRNKIINKKLKDAEKARKAALPPVTTNIIESINPDDAEKWVTLIGKTIKGVARDLSIEVNEFVKTPVGMVTIALIVYKVIGDDIKRMVFGALGWLITMPLLILSLRKFHMSERIKTVDSDKKITNIQYTPRHNWRSDDAKTASAVFHVVGFFIVTLIAILLIAV